MKSTLTLLTLLTLQILLLAISPGFTQQSNPNILFIVADDLGIDALDGFGLETNAAATPNLDNLRAGGLTFTNTWATPQCSPTRAAVITGKYGIKTGVMRPGNNLDLIHESIFSYIKENTDNAYATALIGKWHLSQPVDNSHPNQHGIQHYDGFMSAGVEDYYNWEKVTNGTVSQEETYVTSYLTDASIDWINEQDQPWFLWLAHAAPHGPFHVPPEGLYTVGNPNNNRRRYQAAIEAMDSETGRLLANIDEDELANTVIVFIGDNGTPNSVLQHYPDGHSKFSMYEGGLRVPMIMAGKGVTRIGEVESGMTQVADLYATFIELSSNQLSGGIHNSLSLKSSMSCAGEIERPYLYSDYERNNILSWAVKNEQYKMIKDEDGNIEFYDISMDILEEDNLFPNLTPEQTAILNEFEAEAETIRNDWSCVDGILNGGEVFLDDCDNTCTTVDELSFELTDCCSTPEVPSVFYESVEGDVRSIYSNGFPNHAYCFTNANIPDQQYRLFELDKTPAISGTITGMQRPNGRPARYFGVAMNGVVFVPNPAAPFIFENQNTGEFNWDFIFEPTNNLGPGMGFVTLDCASAHTGPQGYHYHGEMFEYLETTNPGITTAPNTGEVLQVGWASDGFPILYKFGPDSEGNIKELQPSFQLLAGLRPGDGITAPCGPYTGKYTNDYEYKCGKGDLDKCNGIAQSITLTTSEGLETFEYFYVVTSQFPQVPRCLVGTPSPDFENGAPVLTGVDADGDGFLAAFDCDDNNFAINPNAVEIEGNDIDENCDDLLSSITDLHMLGYIVGPNPNAGQFKITSPDSEVFEIAVIDAQGRTIQRQQASQSMLVKGLSSGIYTVILVKNLRQIGQAKVVVVE